MSYWNHYNLEYRFGQKKKESKLMTDVKKNVMQLLHITLLELIHIKDVQKITDGAAHFFFQ